MKDKETNQEIDKSILHEIEKTARREGEKGRNQALAILSLFALISSFGVWSLIASIIQKTVEEQTGNEVLSRTIGVSSQVDSLKTEAEASLAYVRSIKDEIEAKPKWHLAQLQNGWTNYTGNYANPASYMVDGSGIVHLRGLIQSGDKGKAVFVLPIGYRPQHCEIIAVQTNHLGIAEIQIFATGQVILTSSYEDWISLAGINFGLAPNSNTDNSLEPNGGPN